jgi:hypothetical protein
MRYLVSCRRVGFVGTAMILVSALWARAAFQDGSPQRVVPLPQAHAHNDYEHKRPLFDALDQGFCSVEADVFLVDGTLLVGHTSADLKPERTLEKLYLDPLRERIKTNGGRVYKNGPTVWLLVDVKTEAKSTYQALDKVLAGYGDILSAVPWISDNWTNLFRWRGVGSMPEDERAKLKEFVARAHQRGRLVRFWATPESVAFWSELRAAGVDLINTDKLEELQKFLNSK